MVSEVVEELAQAHPARPATAQVVRNALEALVATGEVERTRQGRSVMYTAPRPESAPPAAPETAGQAGTVAAPAQPERRGG